VATLPAHFLGEANAADIHVTPDGQFLYASERQSSTLTGFRIDASNSFLTPIGHWNTETTPRSFAIDPCGRFLLAAGLHSNRLSVHAIDPEDGGLEPRAQYPLLGDLHHHVRGLPPRFLRLLSDRLRHVADRTGVEADLGQGAVILYGAGIGAIASAVIWGALGDHFGRKVQTATGTLICAISAGCIGLLPTGAWITLAILRFFVGFGLAAGVTPALTIVVEQTPTRWRTGMTSFFVVFASAGTLLA
jgi:hypothetical protein